MLFVLFCSCLWLVLCVYLLVFYFVFCMIYCVLFKVLFVLLWPFLCFIGFDFVFYVLLWFSWFFVVYFLCLFVFFATDMYYHYISYYIPDRHEDIGGVAHRVEIYINIKQQINKQWNTNKYNKIVIIIINRKHKTINIIITKVKIK